MRSDTRKFRYGNIIEVDGQKRNPGPRFSLMLGFARRLAGRRAGLSPRLCHQLAQLASGCVGITEEERKKREELERILEENNKKIAEAQAKLAEEQLRIVEEQRKIHEERMKLEKEKEKQKKEEQKLILGKGNTRPKLSFALKSS